MGLESGIGARNRLVSVDVCRGRYKTVPDSFVVDGARVVVVASQEIATARGLTVRIRSAQVGDHAESR